MKTSEGYFVKVAPLGSNNRNFCDNHYFTVNMDAYISLYNIIGINSGRCIRALVNIVKGTDYFDYEKSINFCPNKSNHKTVICCRYL